MRTLVTFPGRAGDIAWMLPTARAIAEAQGDPVDLCIAGEFSGMVPLLECQPYLGKVWAEDAWSLSPPDAWKAPILPVVNEYDRVVHLGYRGWPDAPLPFYTYSTLLREYPEIQVPLTRPDLTRPWITVDGPGPPVDLAVGWSDCYFELKVGLLVLLQGPFLPVVLAPTGSRWDTEHPHGYVAVQRCGWLA
ncbi:MAG TPA: hypothetical protein VIM84_14860, partial [Gemmatimonadales bacterium]